VQATAWNGNATGTFLSIKDAYEQLNETRSRFFFFFFFFHHHRNLSRVFTISGFTYRVYYDCGEKCEYSLESMAMRHKTYTNLFSSTVCSAVADQRDVIKITESGKRST
jgi:hypothetical protein